METDETETGTESGKAETGNNAMYIRVALGLRSLVLDLAMEGGRKVGRVIHSDLSH